MTPALLVSVAALIFTVASFWWLQARRGKLIMSSIPAFSGYVATDRRLGVRLPIWLYNTGARTRLVDELRLVFPSWDDGQAQGQPFMAMTQPRSNRPMPAAALSRARVSIDRPRLHILTSRGFFLGEDYCQMVRRAWARVLAGAEVLLQLTTMLVCRSGATPKRVTSPAQVPMWLRLPSLPTRMPALS